MNFLQVGGGNCSLCGSPGVTKATCPCNPTAKNPNPSKHPNAKQCPKVVKAAKAVKTTKAAKVNLSKYPLSEKEIRDYNVVLDWLQEANQKGEAVGDIDFGAKHISNCSKIGNTYKDLVARLNCFMTAECLCPGMSPVNYKDYTDIGEIYFDDRQCDGGLYSADTRYCEEYLASYIPKEIQSLKKLKSIDLGFTTFTSLPKELENMPGLKEVSFIGPRTNFSKKAMNFYKKHYLTTDNQAYVYSRKTPQSKLKLLPETLRDSTHD